MTASTPAPGALEIGEFAERTGTTPPTIRYYEAIGLLPRPARDCTEARDIGQTHLDAVRARPRRSAPARTHG